MKKFSIMASVLLFSTNMLNADITIKTGWQLLSATDNMNATMFNNTCINYMWKYDTTDATSNPKWLVQFNLTISTLPFFSCMLEIYRSIILFIAARDKGMDNYGIIL